jgi:hypothetical protein
MPKKHGYKEDTRGLKAKAQKAASAAEKSARAAREVAEMEAFEWSQGADQHGARKAAAEAEKRRRKDAARAAKNEAEAADAADLASMKKRKGKARKAVKAGKKMSAFERQMMAAAKKKRAEKRAREAARLNGEAIVVDAQAKLVEQAPLKRNDNARRGAGGDVLEATNIEDALSILDLASKGGGGGAVGGAVDRHPERRMKAAFAAFKERESARIREEHKGLKRTQIDERVWKLWQKSDENPMRNRDA